MSHKNLAESLDRIATVRYSTYMETKAPKRFQYRPHQYEGHVYSSEWTYSSLASRSERSSGQARQRVTTERGKRVASCSQLVAKPPSLYGKSRLNVKPDRSYPQPVDNGLGITCGQTSQKNLAESLDKIAAIRYSTYMNHNTYYTESTTCRECDKQLILDEDGYWCDKEDHFICSVKPIWNNTRLVGWDRKDHSPVVEVK